MIEKQYEADREKLHKIRLLLVSLDRSRFNTLYELLLVLLGTRESKVPHSPTYRNYFTIFFKQLNNVYK